VIVWDVNLREVMDFGAIVEVGGGEMIDFEEG
jgi:hypothetical protein